MRFTLLIILFSFLFSSCKFDVFQNGDIIFQISKSQQSKAIQMATQSQYSHVGVIFINRGKTFVYEAVQPVKLTPIDEWIKRGENEHFVVKRLKNANEILTKENQKKLQNEGLKFIGRKYDLYFGWSDKRIYCSELVWKIYKRALKIEVGKLDSLKVGSINS
ncbi:MAG TPA: YiiX family permuted papain-like enzyme [Paludibacteraceae bacterium]|nr:YiiX family permuted papain-like enzyme [Paludibacteraceae bacterium]HPH64003.1 YiiX family permuted papain-like enzyme [Paludibacteraceae bacterium]